MPWHQCFLLFLVFSVVDSKQDGLPNTIKNVAVRTNLQELATVEWTSFELDATHFIIQVQHPDGTLCNKTVEANQAEFYSLCSFPSCATLYLPSPFYDKTIYLTENETSIIRVTAINPKGEGPSSSDIYYFNGPAQRGDLFFGRDLYPEAPINLRVEWSSGNQVKVVWDEVKKRNVKNWRQLELLDLTHPPEYTIHFGHSQNVSTWNQLKTNNTWIILDNSSTFGSAYVTATDGNKTSLNSQVIAISGYDDMTGLPEPVITIESANKKGTFSPGDWMLFKCSLPPNTNMRDLIIELTVGPRVARKEGRLDTWATLDTLADESINTATCVVTYTKTSGRRTRKLTWNVHQILNDEYLKRREQETRQDWKRGISNNISCELQYRIS